jgi:general secretion pathway protein D
MRVKVALIGLAMVMPLAAWSQFDFGGGAGESSVKPWESLLPKKQVKLKLSLGNATADSVISLFEQVSGISIVKDPALTGKLPITSAKAVDLSTAFQILNTTLDLKGFSMTKEGNLLVIKQKPGGGRGPAGGFDFRSLIGQQGGQDQTSQQLKVYPIQYANAAQVAKVINDVYAAAPTGGFTGQGNNNPFGGFGGGRGNRGGGGGIQLNLGAAMGQQGFGGRNNQPQIKASSDDFSNSVIVNAPEREQLSVKDIIRQIDKQTDQPQTSRVYHLTYAAATDIASVVQNVLVSNAPTGKGGAGQQNVDPGQRFQQALRLGGAQASFGTVAADARTNSLVVTATPENQEVVRKVINQLDTPIETHTTTFVFPLQNAKASDVASLLLSTFGQRQGVSNTAARSTASSHTTTISTSGGSSSSGSSSRPTSLGSVPNSDLNASIADLPQRPATAQDGNIPVELQDPSATSGELLTSVGVTQGFGGGFGGGGGGGQRQGGGFAGGFGGSQTQTSQAGTLARDASGQLIQVKDLTGQVTAIADPNTNSVIVVTTPDGADIIRKVLDQLDKIPTQVVIQTMIVEASLDATDKLGVEWKFINNGVFHQTGAQGVSSTNFGDQTTPAAQGFAYTLTSNNLDAYVNALKTDTKFRVLSTPRIFTSNNVTAQINISQSIPYVTSSIESTTGTFSYNYAFVDVGIILTVTPQITSNGYVTMDVTQTANTLQSYTSFNAPIVNQRQATTTVSVKNNETVILGGIIQRTITATTNKVPILGDIPLLGNLFRSTTKDDNKTELLVFMTPRIVNNNQEASQVTRDSISQLGPDTQKLINTAIKDVKLPAIPSNVNGGGTGTPTGKTPSNGTKGAGGN